MTASKHELSATKRALVQQRLAGRLARAGIPRRPPGTEPPMSFAQERVWFME